MSLRFIYGRAGSGKTRFCLSEIKREIDNKSKKPLILLVPEQFTFHAEKELIKTIEKGGIIGTEVLSFRRMATRIFENAGGLTRPHINNAGKCMMIYRLLDKMKDQFIFYSKSADHKGFVNKLNGIISEFKRYNISPEQLDEFIGDTIEGLPLREKLTELKLMYSVFNDVIEEKYRNSDDDLKIAAEKLTKTEIFKDAEIWIDSFEGFTPQEYLVIEELFKTSYRVNVALCTDSLKIDEKKSSIDVFAEIINTYKKLVNIANENSVKIEESVQIISEKNGRFANSPELAHLENNINTYPAQTYDKKTKDITLFASVNPFAETEACAREIIRLCRDEHLRYRDIGVIAGNLGTYENIIEAVFGDFEIPYFLDRKKDITSYPLIRIILSMMDIFIENWSYESVFTYLKTGLTNIEKDDIDVLENYVLEYGIRGNKWIGEKEWSAEKVDRINEIRYSVIEPLMNFRTKTKGRRTAAQFCESLFEFLCFMNIPEKIEQQIETFKNEGEVSFAKEYSQVWKTVMDVFDQIVEVMGEENTFGIERFSDILKIGFAEYKIGLIPATLDQVVVGNIQRSKSSEIKVLLVMGANDGQFPMPIAEEGVLSDADRTKLRDKGIELANDTKTRALEERHLIYKSLTSAGKILRISWPIADRDGKTMRPSRILSEIKKIFPQITESSDIQPPKTSKEEIEKISVTKPVFMQMVSELRRKSDGEIVSGLWQEIFKWFREKPEWNKKVDSAIEMINYRNVSDRISKNNIDNLYGDVLYSSVSKIESYSQCPFAFFAQYGLKAEDRKIADIRMTDVGMFLHKAIELFCVEIDESKTPWTEVDLSMCEKMVAEIIEKQLAEIIKRQQIDSKRYIKLTRRLKRLATRAVVLITEHINSGNFRPLDYEISFRDNAKIPPIEIELNLGKKVKLTGVIDRIDALETEDGTYLRIVDYKTGSIDFNLEKIYEGLQIQLITYLDAVSENGYRDIKEPVKTAGILYFHINDPIIQTQEVIEKEEAESIIRNSLKMKGLLIDDVDVLKEMEFDIETKSMYLPISFKKDGNFSKNSAIASNEQFEHLKKHVKKILKEKCREIVEGNVNIYPYKKGQYKACHYCSYLPVCQFDRKMKDSKYNEITSRTSEDIWYLLENEYETKDVSKDES